MSSARIAKMIREFGFTDLIDPSDPSNEKTFEILCEKFKPTEPRQEWLKKSYTLPDDDWMHIRYSFLWAEIEQIMEARQAEKVV